MSEKIRIRKNEAEELELLIHMFGFFGAVQQGDEGQEIVERIKASGRWSQWCATTGMLKYIVEGIKDSCEPDAFLKVMKAAALSHIKIAPMKQAVDPEGKFFVVPQSALYGLMECASDRCDICFGDKHDRKGCLVRNAIKEMFVREDWRIAEERGQCVGKCFDWKNWRQFVRQ